jgi:hypothetical protein
MLRIKGKVVTYGEIWYDEEPPSRPGVDVLVCRQRGAAPPGVAAEEKLTLVSDVSVPEDAIAESFINTCRYQIRRADTKDGLTEEFITEPAGRLDEFCEYFDAFAPKVSIDPADRQWLGEACRTGMLVLSTARAPDGTTLVWHAYFRRGSLSQLQHSASYFRDGDADHRNLVGRANRWLHWRDMLAFKRLGVTRYDWGGVFEDDSTPVRAGINNFKRSFGGRLERRCEYAVPVSALGRIFLPLRDAWRRRRAASQPAGAKAGATA